MGEPALKGMSIDEFISWAEQDPEVRYELVDGRPRAKSPVSQAHGRIAGNLAYEIGRRLRPPCALLVAGAIERNDRDDLFYEADLAVTCTPAAKGARSTSNPVMIVEILSESTADHELGTKVPDYVQIPSVQEILLIHSRAVAAQLWRRDGRRWIVEDFTGDDALPLMSIDAEIPLPALYEGVAL